MPSYLTQALKEWAAVVMAMEGGLQTVLLRKGGIAEDTGDFAMEYPRFLLYPTFEHQKPEFLKPIYRQLYEFALAERQGNMVNITSYAEVLNVEKLSNMAQVDQYKAKHIWTDEYVSMRLNYKPDRPLWLLQIKVFKLATALQFVETADYAGCRSWVTLDEAADTDDSTSVSETSCPL